MKPWNYGTLEHLNLGTMELWSYMEPLNYVNFRETICPFRWKPYLEPWKPGTKESWNYGTLELLNPVTMILLELWNFGTIEPWNSGTMDP